MKPEKYMRNHLRNVYDWTTILFVLLLIGAGTLAFFVDSSFFYVLLFVALAYTLAVLMLAVKVERQSIQLVFTILGSILFIGLLPLIVYCTHHRKLLPDIASH